VKLFSTLLVACLFAAPAFGKNLKCRASDSSNSVASRTDIPVSVVEGALTSKTVVTPYAGYKVSVVHQMGDRFEPQTMLRISAGDFAAQSYNLSDTGLYQLMGKNLFIQCWFE
jgi:hypothetical protein